VITREIEKKPFSSAVSNNPGINARPRSAKPLNNGIPIFTHERAEERATKKHQTIQIPQFELAPNEEKNNVLLRYSSVLSNRPTQLCDQHRKKFADFTMYRNLTKDIEDEFDKGKESDGNASADEADTTLDAGKMSFNANKPTFEEYVNKYVFTKTLELKKKPFDNQLQPPNSSVSKQRVSQNIDLSVLDTSALAQENGYNMLTDENRNSENKSKSKRDVNEFLPKFLAKQIIDKRASSYSNLQSLGMASTITVVNCNGKATLMNINDNILAKEKPRVPSSANNYPTPLSRLNQRFISEKQNDGTSSKFEETIDDDSVYGNFSNKKGSVEKTFRPIIMKKKYK